MNSINLQPTARTRLIGAFGAAALALVPIVQARAAILPVAMGSAVAEATYFLDGSGDSGALTTPRTAFYQLGLSTETAFAAAAGMIKPAVTTSAIGRTTAVARATYSFQVTGPSDPELKLYVDSIVGVLARSDTEDTAYASVQILRDGAEILFLDACEDHYTGTSCFGTFASSYFHGRSFDVAPENLFTVNLFAVSQGLGPESFATATADPYFYFDPDFLRDHPGYSLEFSEGAGNAPVFAQGVPEPGAWALLIAGFGILGTTLRRRVRGGAVPAA